MYMYVYTSICMYVLYLLHVLGRHMHVYASICKYMHVYHDHILAYTNCLQVCICMHMYVYVGICRYVTYMYVLCLYMHVFPGMTPTDTGTYATSPKNTLRGRQLAGHTQGTPEHPRIHFFQPSATVVQTRFGAPQPAARVQGLRSVPLVPHGGLPCIIHAL